jgi:hypothetical protein
MSLNTKPVCKCCTSVRNYIAEHLDPSGTLDGTEDAAEVVRQFNQVFRDEGGAGVSVEDMADYLAAL